MNLYEKDKSHESSFCAADFVPFLFAYDETVSKNLGIPQSDVNQFDIRKINGFQGKLKSFKKSKEEKLDRNESNKYGPAGSKYDDNNTRTARTIYTVPNGDDYSRRSHHSNSIIQTADSSGLNLAFRKWQATTFNPEVKRLPNHVWKGTKGSGPFYFTSKPSVTVTSVERYTEALPVGLPNFRALPKIPETPRIHRTRMFLSKLKGGLKEHIEWQTTQLQQAELDQNTEMENKAFKLLNQLQQRLKTIRALEYEYVRNWKLYKQIRSSSLWKLDSQFVNNSSQPSGIDNLYLASKREFSKSTLGLVRTPISDEFMHLISADSTLSTNIEKPSRHSSLLNLFRHRSKRTQTIPTSFTSVEAKSVASQKTLKSKTSNRYSQNLTGECTQFSISRQQCLLLKRLCQIEAQTEYLSGTLICEVLGISGYVPGIAKDVYKISLRYGLPELSSIYEFFDDKAHVKPLYMSTIPLNQQSSIRGKWSIVGRVLSNLSLKHHSDLEGFNVFEQKWDQTEHIFSPTIGDVLTIKAYVLHRFGKSEILVQQACDILNTFTLKGHRFSIALKHSSDFQFHFILRWCPLADTQDDYMVFYRPSSLDVSTANGEVKHKTANIRFLITDEDNNSDSRESLYNRRTKPSSINSSRGSHLDERMTLLNTRSMCDCSLAISEEQICEILSPKHRLIVDDAEKRRNIVILNLQRNHTDVPSNPPRSVKAVNGLSSWISMPNLETDTINRVVKQPNNNSPVRIIKVKSSRESERVNFAKSAQSCESIGHYIPKSLDLQQTTRLGNHFVGDLSDKLIQIKAKLFTAVRQQSNRHPEILQRLCSALETLSKQLQLNSEKFGSRKVKKTLLKDYKPIIASSNSNSSIPSQSPIGTLSSQASPSNYHTEYGSSISGTNSHGKIRKLSKVFEQKIGRQNTLTLLMESFAFLDDAEKSYKNGDKSHGLTNSDTEYDPHSIPVSTLNEHRNDTLIYSVPVNAGSICPGTTIFNDTNYPNGDIEDVLTTGWKQYDLALLWHFEYIDRLIDRIGYSTLNNELKTGNTVYDIDTCSINNTTESSNTLDLIRMPLHAQLACLSLSGQIEFIREAVEFAKTLIRDPHNAQTNYVCKILGDGVPCRVSLSSCFLFRLVWPNRTNHTSFECISNHDNVTTPQLMLDRGLLRDALITLYKSDLVPKWPKEQAEEVVTQFLDDVLDTDVNPLDLQVVPLTHLNQRLQLSRRMDVSSLPLRSATRTLPRYRSKYFNNYFLQILSYLAGQVHIQRNLRNMSCSRTLSTLSYFTRSYQPLFGLLNILDDVGVDVAVLDRSEIGWELKNIEICASHSTKTWLEVASLLSNHDEEIVKKATNLLINLDTKTQKAIQLMETKLNQRVSDSNLQSSIHVHRQPILFTAGPSIHVIYAMLSTQKLNHTEPFPPVWWTMVYGIEHTDRYYRLAGLRALTMLLEHRKNCDLPALKGPVKWKTKQNNVNKEFAGASRALLDLFTHIVVTESDTVIQEATMGALKKLVDHTNDNLTINISDLR